MAGGVWQKVARREREADFFFAAQYKRGKANPSVRPHSARADQCALLLVAGSCGPDRLFCHAVALLSKQGSGISPSPSIQAPLLMLLSPSLRTAGTTTT